MFVSDEADRNNGQRAAEPASECHNTDRVLYFNIIILIFINSYIFKSVNSL